MTSKKLGLFEAYGVELEYMIVDRETFDIRPLSDELLFEVAGSYVPEVARGPIAWSNELVMHVIELKTNGPVSMLKGLSGQFQDEVNEINSRLESFNACLMPGAMHPWMNPFEEMKLWPHEYNPIYEAYDRIFNCKGHGWANVQSTHLNLPFSGDTEFEKLHAAIRVLLPLLPALAASSPVADLARKGYLDYRMEVYRTNSARIPSVTGFIVPEAVFSYREYDEQIFQRMYRDIRPYDPDNILQDEWLNSRGAIARFDRGSIEIRVLDIQECPVADLAIIHFISDVLKALVNEQWSSLDEQKKWGERDLYEILTASMLNAEHAVIKNPAYLRLFGIEVPEIRAGELWEELFNKVYHSEDIAENGLLTTMESIIKKGTLSSRMLKALPETITKDDMFSLCRALSESLKEGKLFDSHGT